MSDYNWGEDGPEPPDFYHVTRRKSRKERICGSCKQPIQAGEVYDRYFERDCGKTFWQSTHAGFNCPPTPAEREEMDRQRAEEEAACREDYEYLDPVWKDGKQVL